MGFCSEVEKDPIKDESEWAVGTDVLHAARSDDQGATGLIATANLVDPYGTSLSDFLI